VAKRANKRQEAVVGAASEGCCTIDSCSICTVCLHQTVGHVVSRGDVLSCYCFWWTSQL